MHDLSSLRDRHVSRRRLAGAGAAALLVATAPAAAATSAPEPGDIGQAIAAVLVFLVLLAVLSKYAWRPVIEALRRREQAVADTVSNAEKKEQKAEQTLQQYQRQLDDAQSDIDALRARSPAPAEQQADRNVGEAKQQARQLSRAQHEDLQRAAEHARQELYTESAELATEIAERLVRRALSEEEHRRLIAESLSDIQQKIREQKP